MPTKAGTKGMAANTAEASHVRRVMTTAQRRPRKLDRQPAME